MKNVGVSKKDSYEKLVADVKKVYSSADNGRENSNIKLTWCQVECREINLWTYWQGLGFGKKQQKIDIMLVGQDWGHCRKGTDDDWIERIKKINKSRDITYFDPDSKREPTDDNLVKFFNCIGYNIIDKNRNQELFFTNFCLGYRDISVKRTGDGNKKSSNSGGMTLSLMKKDVEFFQRLFCIVKPKRVICLGQNTYEAVCAALGKPIKKLSFQKLVDDELENPEKFAKWEYEGIESKIYAFPHCGGWGMNNRYHGNMEKAKKEWKKLFGKK